MPVTGKARELENDAIDEILLSGMTHVGHGQKSTTKSLWTYHWICSEGKIVDNMDSRRDFYIVRKWSSHLWS
jgi:hypothetical protein